MLLALVITGGFIKSGTSYISKEIKLSLDYQGFLSMVSSETAAASYSVYTLCKFILEMRCRWMARWTGESGGENAFRWRGGEKEL